MTTDTTQAKLKHIHQSFQAAFESLPAYRHMLPFFETLFTLQEAAVAATSPAPLEITPEIRAARLEGQLPMLDRSRMPYDKSAAMTLLLSICREAATANDQLAAGAEAITSALEKRRAIVERGIDLFMGADQSGIRVLSAELGLDASILGFFMYHSTWPSVARHADLIADTAAIEANWTQGFCPVCGSTPDLAFLTDNGGRMLVCDFCRHQWPFKRILCPACLNTDSKTINYFFSEQEPANRVYTCDACKKYIKTVDTRRLTRPFYPPLERIVTTHLDLQAREMGYQNVSSETFGAS